ncbi:MAG: FAD/NAD(P)-binding protein [Nitriliruptoraceae bacterium]|nr:FAD/NAD(P)-binding protein [Nitriliruptoraceae bacterium]
MTGDAYRIAIVGMGPRGFGCLERLAIELSRRPVDRAVHVTLHDPAPHPGAGPIYAPDQPDEMLMNLAVRHVTAWSTDASERLGVAGEDLERWLARHHPTWALASGYVPRRLVGAYFEAAFGVLLAHLPVGLAVTSVRAEVTDLRRDEGRWLVCHGESAADRRVDEVVCTVGHGLWSHGGRPGPLLTMAPAGSARVISPPYPVRQALGLDAVPAGAVVGVRGFALTFIDVALHLTVGRGSTFDGMQEFVSAGAPWPVHVAGADAVARLVPWSRTGAPLAAKPGPGLAAAAAELEPDWIALRAALRTAGVGAGTPDPLTVISSTLAHAARTALRRLGVRVDDRARAVIAATLDPDPIRAVGQDLHDGPAALAAMRRSAEVALGRRAPDAAWALGEVWRQGYPGLVERVGHGGLPVQDRPYLAVLARRMERLGFGAPVDNIAPLVALADAGTLDLRSVQRGGVLTDRGRLRDGAGAPRPVDVVVDSVLPSPGAARRAPLWGALLRRGVIRTGAATRGVEVSRDATCIGRDGRPAPGLAAVGRVTEGWVLGNDTLNRTLHPETERWARRIVHDLQRGPFPGLADGVSALRTTARSGARP